MPVREVLRHPDPRLKRAARPVVLPGEEELAARVAQDLVDTMEFHPRCVGVAAPQIADAVRMCVVDCSEHPKATVHHGRLVLVNPVIVAHRGEEVGREGCLSIPELTANVRRALWATVEATDPTGRPVRIVAEGFEARALQHEIDHLDGLLFLDRVTMASDIFRRKSRG